MTSQLELAEYEDRNAVVVGIGNSGIDCAVELRFEFYSLSIENHLN